jgi:hypothetical protein
MLSEGFRVFPYILQANIEPSRPLSNFILIIFPLETKYNLVIQTRSLNNIGNIYDVDS